MLVPRRRGDDEVAESLLDDMCSPCTLMSARQRAQAANGLLDMIQDGRIAAESLLRRGAMAIVIPLMGQPVDGM